MKIRCIIVDDDPLAIAVIENYVGKMPNLELIGKCNSPINAYEMLSENQIDLMFLDVEMPEISGIDFLKTLEKPPRVIITSGNKEYAIQGFELNVLDYLVKPVSFERFLKAVNKYPKDEPKTTTSSPDIVPVPSTVDDEFIYVKENKKMVKITLKNILTIESIKDYVKIKTTIKTVVTKQQLSYFEEKLPSKDFLRIHRSLLVNVSKIDAYSATSVEIAGEELPIGRSYKNDVLESLQKLIGT